MYFARKGRLDADEGTFSGRSRRLEAENQKLASSDPLAHPSTGPPPPPRPPPARRFRIFTANFAVMD